MINCVLMEGLCIFSLVMGVKVKPEVKVKGRGQILRSRSKVKVIYYVQGQNLFYWHGVVDIGTWLCQVKQKVQ